MKTISRLNQLAALIGGHLHELEEIPLKNEPYGCCDSPSAPTLYVSGRQDSKVFDLPKEGKASINYRIRSKSVSYREDGSERYSTDIEVKTIEPTGLEAVLANYEFDDRARDSGGRYAPGNDVSTDDMADAYVKPKKRKAALLVGAGLAGATAAVAGRKALPSVSQGVGRLVRGALG